LANPLGQNENALSGVIAGEGAIRSLRWNQTHPRRRFKEEDEDEEERMMTNRRGARARSDVRWT
jgi:hypothetical protein